MATINETAFVKRSLEQKIRVDSRDLNDFRSLKISCLGAGCTVLLGKTRVLAHVSADIVRPLAANPTEGILIFNTQFSSMSSPAIQSSASEEETRVSRLLEKAFRRSRALDTEGLCIVASEKVWQIRIDIRILDHEGNVVDCACIAAITALLNFKRPEVTVSGYDIVVVISIVLN
jgi:exosome complex component RRP45